MSKWHHVPLSLYSAVSKTPYVLSSAATVLIGYDGKGSTSSESCLAPIIYFFFSRGRRGVPQTANFAGRPLKRRSLSSDSDSNDSDNDSESDKTNYGDNNNNISCSIDDSIGNRDNCNQTNQDNINLLMLNVCGLTNKLKFDVFTEKITQYKIICLTEIKADEIDCISIKKFADDNGYQCYCKPREKVIRKSGGMCVLFHNDIADYAREVKSNLDIVQWFILDRTLFRIDKDLLLGNVYLPPANSPYAHTDMFNDLEMSLLELNYINYYSLITGDFNAHTSTKEDFINLSQELALDVDAINC